MRHIIKVIKWNGEYSTLFFKTFLKILFELTTQPNITMRFFHLNTTLQVIWETLSHKQMHKEIIKNEEG